MKTYQQGHEAAYTEIYATVDSEDHHGKCGTCWACGVMRTVTEDTFMKLGQRLPQEGFSRNVHRRTVPYRTLVPDHVRSLNPGKPPGEY